MKIILTFFCLLFAGNFLAAQRADFQKEIIPISKSALAFPERMKLQKQDAQNFYTQLLEYRKKNPKAEFAVCLIQSGEVFLSGNFTKDANFDSQPFALGKTSRGLLTLALASVSSREKISFSQKISSLNPQLAEKILEKFATLNSLQYKADGLFLSKHSDKFAKTDFEPNEIFSLSNLIEREFSDVFVDNDSSFSYALASYILTDKIFGETDNANFQKLIQKFLFDFLDFKETNFLGEHELPNSMPKIFYPNVFAKLSMQGVSNWLIAETSLSVARQSRQIANIDEFDARFIVIKDTNFASCFKRMRVGDFDIFMLGDNFLGNANAIFICPKYRIAFFVVAKNSDDHTCARISSFMLETLRIFTQKHEISRL